jgi:hypothetical protein
MTLIVIASTTPTAGTTTAAWTSTTEATFVGLGAGFIDVQSAAAKFSTVQRSNCLFSFAGVGHLDKSESSRATCIALGNDAYLLDGAVGFKQRPQLCLGGAVRDVAHKKLLHTLPRFARFTSILAYLIKVLRQASGRRPDCPNCGNQHGLKSFIPGPCAGLRWFRLAAWIRFAAGGYGRQNQCSVSLSAIEFLFAQPVEPRLVAI